MADTCCTCAASLVKAKSTSPPYRRLPCCARLICARCLASNARLATYCLYCQIATAPPPSHPSASSSASDKENKNEKGKFPSVSSTRIDLLPPGLRPPPPYHLTTNTGQSHSHRPRAEPPPPYSAAVPPHPEVSSPPEKPSSPSVVLHYLDHDRDSVASLALRYHIPADRLRRANRLTVDHLLLARHVIQIPLDGPSCSLSPVPVESEPVARRKAAIRRFMVACKVVDYDLAVLYLEQTAPAQHDTNGNDSPCFDLTAAIAAYEADEVWAQAHPMTPRMPRRTLPL